MSIINAYLGTSYSDSAEVVLDCPEASVVCDESVMECVLEGQLQTGSICVFSDDAASVAQTVDIFMLGGQVKSFLIGHSYVSLPFEERIPHMTPVAPFESSLDISDGIRDAYRYLSMPWFYEPVVRVLSDIGKFMVLLAAGMVGFDLRDTNEAGSAQDRYPHEFIAEDGAVLDYLPTEHVEEVSAVVVEEKPAAKLNRRPSGYSADGEVLRYLP